MFPVRVGSERCERVVKSSAAGLEEGRSGNIRMTLADIAQEVVAVKYVQESRLKMSSAQFCGLLIDNNGSNASEYVSGSMTIATQGRRSLNPGTSRNAIGSRYEAKRTYGYRHKQEMRKVCVGGSD
jgi:hypothetical protein